MRGIWSYLVCEETFCGVVVFEWTAQARRSEGTDRCENSIFCFSNKVINRWHLLDQLMMDAPSINAFRSRLVYVRDNGWTFSWTTVRWALGLTGWMIYQWGCMKYSTMSVEFGWGTAGSGTLVADCAVIWILAAFHHTCAVSRRLTLDICVVYRISVGCSEDRCAVMSRDVGCLTVLA